MIITIVFGAFFVLVLAYTLAVSTRLKCRPMKLFRTLMPTFIINLSSANYGASFLPSFNTMLENGVDADFLSMGHNLGGLLFKPGYGILFIGSAVGTAFATGMDVSVGWIVMVLILSFVLAMSIPTIPSAGVSGLTVLFSRLAFSGTSLSIAIAVNVILNFFTVAVNGYILQCKLILDADREGKLNRERFCR